MRNIESVANSGHEDVPFLPCPSQFIAYVSYRMFVRTGCMDVVVSSAVTPSNRSTRQNIDQFQGLPDNRFL